LLSALLLTGGFVVFVSTSHALPEKDIRTLVTQAESFESQANWEQARHIYEGLLGQNDPGLRIRDRYQNAQRRCWQSRRHMDSSYQMEVLSVDYGQALHICKIVNRTLLDGSFDKRKVDPSKLFKKGIDEFDAALSDSKFVAKHVKQGNVEAFRNLLQRLKAEARGLSRENALERIGQIALLAEAELGIDATVTVMEFACGACYAIDDYTVYLTPNQLRELAQSLVQTEASVGLGLAIQENKIVIRTIDRGSPAEQLLNENDEIISVNMQAVTDINLNRVTELLRGQAGTMVEIEFLSPGEDQTRRVTLTRQAVATGVRFGPIAMTPYYHLKISSFSDAAIQDLNQALKQPNMKGLVLDLRQNGGGIVENAIETAKKFLAKGTICSSVHQDTKKSVVYHAKNPDALTVPLIVLVDNDTASAAEVLAGALKENDRAILIGQTTFGKGCTQTLLRLGNAPGNVPTGGMRLTVAQIFSPKSNAYSGRGVTPHIFVDDRMMASQSLANADPSLDRAIEELNRLQAMPK